MNCTITIKGNGSGGYGVPKTDRTGPLSEFLVDNNHFYSQITKHLKDCPICKVNDVLTEYLRRRVEIPKFNGATSVALANRAIVLERLAIKKGETLTPGLVNEIIWRGGVESVIKYMNFGTRFSLVERYNALELSFTLGRFIDTKKLSQENMGLYSLILHGAGVELDSAGLRDLLNVADVMLS